MIRALHLLPGEGATLSELQGDDVRKALLVPQRSGLFWIDVINQTQAVARALERVNALILGSHLNTCVTTAIRGDDAQERERVLGELMQVFQHSAKL